MDTAIVRGKECKMRIKKELVRREIAGDIILVPTGKTVLENNGLFVLNDVGAAIWDMLTAGKNEDEILEALQETYEADPAMLQRDTTEFLAKLADMGILECP